jgi:putative transposase
MHLTLKREATKPAGPNALQQQARFDAFLERYNRERPHGALAMRVPADLYVPSPRPYQGVADLDYPFHDGRRQSPAVAASAIADAKSI